MTDLSNWAPFQILVGPGDVYVAATGTAFPKVSEAPSGSWTYLGQTDGGISVKHDQTITPLTTDQRTGNVKAVRTAESLDISFSLAELTLENYSLAMNSLTVTAEAGPPAIKKINLHKGVAVDLRAILIRGRSPYGNLPAQYQIPVLYQSESPEVSFSETDKSLLATVWTVLEDLSQASDALRFGQLVAQTS
jgi:hypothetical protein